MATFTGTSGADNFIGTNTAADTFRFAASFLTNTDTVTGGLGTVSDILELTSAGDVSAADLAHVSGIETVRMFAGAAIDLTALMATTSRTGTITVAGSSGDDTVYGYNISDPSNRLSFTANSGDDIFVGGSGGDVVNISANQLNARDIFSGGAGTDTLKLSSASILDATDLLNVFSFERIQLADGSNSIALSQAMVGSTTTGSLTVIGGTGNDTVDASAVTATGSRVSFDGGAGDDTFVGGSGNDVIDAGTGDNEIIGGAGTDSITLSTDGVDTIHYNFLSESGSRAGDTIRGATGLLDETDFFLAFNETEFSVNGALDTIVTDDGSSPIGPGGRSMVPTSFSMMRPPPATTYAPRRRSTTTSLIVTMKHRA
ncbi:hypothetical protein D3874_05080 [Oleomonas cavernae]|uniref:Calcium-binding protein n=1 Tax=Oleomonas cavernae TaxID=2320859 RepID=A0A418W8Y5_9PROT|nr:hypothetical protein [Oleomonas cavernae]RJF86475.1 hypothetical protein D3874_05080 [Oleomonas cavernae]